MTAPVLPAGVVPAPDPTDDEDTTMDFTGMLWGYKFLRVDLTTDDHQGGRFRYRPGEWHQAPGDDGTFTGNECPSFPGDGLCVARTLRGAQSGGARLGASTMVLVGYRPGDVLSDSGDKVRVRRLWVAPDPLDPVSTLIGPDADLGDAYLGGAYLGGADLGGADLGDAYLGGADLRDAYLGGADLGGADLRDAYLGGADLGGAYLGGADLGGANLGDAYLGGANLRDAYLGGANLRDAYLGGANLGGANRPGWLPAKWTVTPDGYITEAGR